MLTDRAVADRPLVNDLILVSWHIPSSDSKVEGVSILVETTLPTLDCLAAGFLAKMAHVAFDRSTSPGSRARMLEKHPPQHLDDGIGDIGVIVRAAHVATFPGKVVAITHFMFLCARVVLFKCFCRRLRIIGVNAVPFLVNRDEFLGFDAWEREHGSQKFFGTTDRGGRGPE